MHVSYWIEMLKNGFYLRYVYSEAQLGGGEGAVAPPLDGQGGRRPPPWFWQFPTQGEAHQTKNQILQILIAHAPPTPPSERGRAPQA